VFLIKLLHHHSANDAADITPIREISKGQDQRQPKSPETHQTAWKVTMPPRILFGQISMMYTWQVTLPK
jgi:hypothetical protein